MVVNFEVSSSSSLRDIQTNLLVTAEVTGEADIDDSIKRNAYVSALHEKSRR